MQGLTSATSVLPSQSTSPSTAMGAICVPVPPSSERTSIATPEYPSLEGGTAQFQVAEYPRSSSSNAASMPSTCCVCARHTCKGSCCQRCCGPWPCMLALRPNPGQRGETFWASAAALPCISGEAGAHLQLRLLQANHIGALLLNEPSDGERLLHPRHSRP